MKDHNKDADCTVDPATECCTECGVWHGSYACPSCGGKGYHTDDCDHRSADLLEIANDFHHADQLEAAYDLRNIAHEITERETEATVVRGQLNEAVALLRKAYLCLPDTRPVTIETIRAFLSRLSAATAPKYDATQDVNWRCDTCSGPYKTPDGHAHDCMTGMLARTRLSADKGVR